MAIQAILEIHMNKEVKMIVPIVFLLIASYTDIKDRKIKNYVTYPMFLIGLLLSERFFVSLGLGVLLGIILIFLPGFNAGMGDVKLVIACGTWFNSLETGVYFLLIAVSLVTLFNIIVLLRREGFLNFLKQLKTELFLIFSKIIPENEINKAPLAPFMFISFMSVMWLF